MAKKERADELRKKQKASELRGKQTSTPEAATPEIGKVESFARGAAQGATFGFADEISAGASASFDSVSDFVQGDASFDQFLTDYRSSLDESRANFEAAFEANPITSTLGSVGGAIATGVGGGIAKLGAVAGGAVAGGLFGAGTSEGTLAEGLSGAGQVAQDVAIGAGSGALLGGLTGPAVLGRLESVVRGKLQVSPKEIMQKFGFSKQAFRSSAGTKSSPEQAIQNLQNRGVLPKDLETFIKLDPKQAQLILKAERDPLGAAIGGAIKRADEVLPDINSNALGLKKLTKSIKDIKKANFDAEINLELDAVVEFVDAAKNTNRATDVWQAKKAIDNVLHTMTKKLDPSALEKTKVRSLFEARGRMKTHLEGIIDEAAKKDIGVRNILEGTGRKTFKEVNADFSDVAGLSKFVDDAAASAAKAERSLGQALIEEVASPTGAAGVVVGGSIAGVPGALAGAGVGAAIRALGKSGALDIAGVAALEAGRTGVRGAVRGIQAAQPAIIQQGVKLGQALYESYDPASGTLISPEEVKVHIGNVLQNKSIPHAERFKEVNRVNRTGQIDATKVAPHVKQRAAQTIEQRQQSLQEEVMSRAMNQLRNI